jgi:hypothetical protein
LFLEAKFDHQPNIDNASYLARRRFDPVAQVPTSPIIHNSKADFDLGSVPWNFGQTIHLGDVAAEALACGVPVYLIDSWASDARNFARPGERVTQAERGGVWVRDQVAAGLFYDIVVNRLGGERKGCLILFGNAHFSGINRLDYKWRQRQLCLSERLLIDYVLFNYD